LKVVFSFWPPTIGKDHDFLNFSHPKGKRKHGHFSFAMSDFLPNEISNNLSSAGDLANHQKSLKNFTLIY